MSANMKVGAYTIAHASSVDGLPRNVTCTRAVIAAGADTPGTVLVTGLDAAGHVISETLTPGADTVLVPGLKAFASVTSVVGAGWIIAVGNDTIVFGFGTLVGLPAAVYGNVTPGGLDSRGAPVAAAQIILATLGGAVVAAPTATFDAANLSGVTVDASASTYDAAKHLYVLIAK